MWAINLANRSANEQRARDITALFSAAHVADYVITPVEMFVEGIDAGRDSRHLARVVVETWNKSDILSRFQSFDRSKLPTMVAYDQFARCSAIIDGLKVSFDAALQPNAAVIDVDHIRERLAKFLSIMRGMRADAVEEAGRSHHKFALRRRPRLSVRQRIGATLARLREAWAKRTP